MPFGRSAARQDDSLVAAGDSPNGNCGLRGIFISRLVACRSLLAALLAFRIG